MSGETYLTKSLARKELRKQLGGAIKILDMKKMMDGKKQLIRERVVAFFQGKNEEIVSILWTDGNNLFQIQSSSLEKALRLEIKIKSK